MSADPLKTRPLRVLSFATGSGAAADVSPHLKNAKSIKLMAKQDCLALSAAARAASAAGVAAAELTARTGVYLTVGTVPFEEEYFRTLVQHATTDGRLDMARFTTEGYNAMNPILTFKCLPNMPLFHISFNLGIQGGYFLSYPGPSQFFSALEAAVADLVAGRVRFALVGGVADQENFLVRHHVRRSGVRAEDSVRDQACMAVLTLEEQLPAKARITGFEQSYRPVDPFAPDFPRPRNHFDTYAGAAEPLLAIRHAIERQQPELSFAYEDGVQARLTLEAL